jgi:hypothetical protein
VMMLDDLTMLDGRADVTFLFIGFQICCQNRTCEAYDWGRQQNEALH